MNIVIYDTEEKNSVVISKHIKEVLPRATVTMFSKAEDLIEFAKEETVHVAFINVDDAGGKGFLMAKEFWSSHPKMNLIFISEHTRYLKEAWNMHISGYLSHIPSKEEVENELFELKYPVELQLGSVSI